MRALLLLILCLNPFTLSFAGERKIVYAFRSATDLNHIKMAIIGETISIEKASVFATKPEYNMMNLDIRPDMVTIKVLYNPGIRVGQTLYLLEKNHNHDAYKDGNIVGQIKVVSVFKTSFFGERLRGEGYLRLIENKPMTAAMELHSEKLHDAIIVKKQGDYFVKKGDIGNAILSYKKSIQLDNNFPDAHYALAKLHNSKSGEGYVSASFEYSQAWKHRSKFREINDKFAFFVDYIRFANHRYKLESSNSLSLGIKSLQKAIHIYEEGKRIHANDFSLTAAIAETYFLLYEYSHRSEGSIANRQKNSDYETMAKKFIEKALKIKKEDYQLQRLATLYYYERYSYLSIGKQPSESQRRQLSYLKNQILNHSQMYYTYIPHTHRVDTEIKRIRDELLR